MRVMDFTNFRTGHLNLAGTVITWHNGDTERFDYCHFHYKLEIKEYGYKNH